MKHVIIIGAGFGGLRLARRLQQHPDFRITLVDKLNHHQFQPLFYQVATAGLDPSNISFPLRKVFRKSSRVQVLLASLQEVLAEENRIITDAGMLRYDYLVLATGCRTNFFGNRSLERYAYPMKSTVEALNIRHAIIENLELATQTPDAGERQRLLNIIIAGAGPTGVELSGTLAEMKARILPKDFPELDFSQMNIYLLEGSDKTLGAMSARSSTRSRQYLETLGVTVRTNTRVTDYDGDEVTLDDGGRLPAALLIWAAGIEGNIPAGIPQCAITRSRRIRTDRQHRVPGFDNLFAIGDLAYMESPNYPNGAPQVCAVAIRHADSLAQNFIERQRIGGKPKDFEYTEPGTMATVGRNKAVVDHFPFRNAHFGGFAAWVAWMGFHLLQLIGVKNKVQVFVNWVFHYFTYDQSLRLLFKGTYRPRRRRAAKELV
ncbi:NAD(P)/FAD-dependent oxidoreductase [Flaviaesturariibacter flavus]|uniref:NADH:ubiquinone reductase (non-electrogenic) n=1 Tax=Flaviaesturariibacter flavus TaxID=2502780 RepID=A0A4R1B688_9BACT|nr:NAD(P)/FAD-dependent oxidoreductase [Flaviaesturariibacter flavus]TCJ13150.1 NAD(P)/FAD-dependent oxidoreductase [Flaviaesturariibacter flavus]